MRRQTYNCEACNWTTQRFYDRGEKPADTVRCAKCGKRAEKLIRMGGAPSSKGWPMTSSAAGVYPYEIDEARAVDAQLGVPCDFTPDGDRIFTDRAHRRNWLRAHKWVDRSAGYGD